MPRTETTLIAILGQRWARVDVDRAGAKWVDGDQHRSPELVEVLDTALSAGGKLGKQIWLLTDQVWLGDIDLPPSAVVGLKDEQLAKAAAYEAESGGGLPAWESATAVSRVRVRNADDRFRTGE